MKYALYVRRSSDEQSGRQIQSVENQIDVLKEKAKREGLKIVKVYEESKSAKTPGRRESFTQMLIDIEAGLIEAIICWDLSRLSRNPIEGGQIQYWLQTSVIKQIVTNEKTYFPSDNSIMMTFELGMSVEYSLALGKNVKRGQSYKIQKGQYPNTAPLGYLNSTHLTKGERVILIDEERFPLVRKLWDLLLTGEHSVYELSKKAEALGLRGRATKSHGERKVSRWGLYKIFTNPFYFGKFRWGKGQGLHHGEHEPMITEEEFEEAQKVLTRRKQAPRAKKHFYTFKGTMKCGSCGASITAEQKNKYRKDGSVNHRIYYRCTHKIKDKHCREISVREDVLEKQFLEILDSLTIPPSFVQWVVKWLYDQSQESTIKQNSILEQQKKRLVKLNDQLHRLLDLRLYNEIDQDTFKAKNEALLAEKRAIEKEMTYDTDSQEERIRKTIEVFEICQIIRDKLKTGSQEQKKIILQVLGSQFYLKDQKLTVELAKPFKLVQDSVTQGWILDPRFATLKSKSEPGLTDSDRLLLLNGGDEGT